MAENTSLWSRLRRSFGASQAEPWFLADQPAAIQNFFQTFEPLDDTERGLFKHMMEAVKRYRIPLSDQHHIIAQLGDADTLRYLFRIHPNDSEIRKHIGGNPRCPEDLAKACIRDPDPKVRASAASSPALKDAFCIGFARYEPDPHVQAALSDRLGPQYPFSQAGADVFPVEVFIGRCFERSLSHPGSALDIAPILAAYREYDLFHEANPERRHLHETVLPFADEALLRSLHSLYRTDGAMLSQILQNPACPEDIRENANYWLSEMAQPNPTLSDHSNSVENTLSKPQFSKSKTQENSGGKKPRASLDSLIQNAQGRFMVQAPSSHVPIKTPHHEH